MSLPVTPHGGHDHAHCNHNHGAEHQLRTLTEHQSNRGSATLAEFQQAAQETTRYLAQDKGRTAELPQHGEVPREGGSHPRPTAKRSAPPQESSRFQGAVSERGSQLMAQSRATPSLHGRMFQHATPASQPTASTPSLIPASGKSTKIPTPQTAKTGLLTSTIQSGSLQQTSGNGTGAKVQSSSQVIHPGGNLLSKGGAFASLQTSADGLLGAATANGKPTQTSLPGALSRGNRIVGTAATGLANGGKVPVSSGFATALAQVPGLSLSSGQTLSGRFFPGQGLSGMTGQVLGFGNRMQIRGLFTTHLSSLKTVNSLGVPLQTALTASALGAFQTLRGPGMFQQLEHSLLNFSNLLFGNYLKGLPQTKLTPNEMMLQQMALMLAAEQKKREKLKKGNKAKGKTHVEKKDDRLTVEETNEEEEFIQHFEKIMEIFKRYRTPNFIIETKE